MKGRSYLFSSITGKDIGLFLVDRYRLPFNHDNADRYWCRPIEWVTVLNSRVDNASSTTCVGLIGNT